MPSSSENGSVPVSNSADRRKSAGILLRVEGGAFASRLLATVSEPGIRARVMAVLRWQRKLDQSLAAFLKRKNLDVEVRIVLRLALAEITVMGIPAPVAGDAAVRLIRELGKWRASGLVNAVIRRAPRKWEEISENAPPDLRFSHPRWIWERWATNFGRAAATGAMESAQFPAPLWVFGLGDGDSVVDGAPHPWMPGAFTLETRKMMSLLASLKVYAMDPSSQLVAHVAASRSRPGALLADLCAAPGGKALRIAHSGKKLEIIAGDRNLRRLRLGLPSMRSTGRIRIVQADVQRSPFPPSSFGLVLLDAPCSGTGTFRRHPELKWSLDKDTIRQRAAMQRGMINQGGDLVEPGGYLLYSTCSVEPEENEEHFIDPADGFVTEPVEPFLPDRCPAIPTPAGGVRILPGAERDGFSMHLLRKTR